jgi:phage-related protein
MDNKEKISVELELLTQKFTSKIKETTSKIKEFGQTAKEQFQIGKNIDISSAKSKLRELENELEKLNKQNKSQSIYGGKKLNDSKIKDLQISIRNLKNDIEQAESKFGKLGQKISNLPNLTKKMGKSKEAFATEELAALLTKSQELKQKLEESTNPKDMAKLIIESKKLEKEIDNICKKSEKFGAKIKKSFDGGIFKVKKFALSLFSIRSIWSLVSRASSSYISQDIELSNKLSAIWIGLGATLSPIIERIANAMLKLVLYVNAFIKGLTGIDLLAKAIAKSTSKTAKSAKEASKSLAGFDEINNIDNSSTASMPDTSWVDAFKNVSVDTKWLDKIKSIGEWIKNNWTDVVSVLLLTKLAIDIITGNWIGIIIDVLGLIVVGAIKIWDAIKVIIKEAPEAFKAMVKIIGDLFKKGWDNLKFGAKTAWEGIKGAFSQIGTFFGGIWNTIKSKFTTIGTKIGDAMGGAFKTVVNAIIKFAESKINGFIKAINFAIDVINKIPGVNISRLSTLNIPKLDVGTNYVPNDQLAMIHKGEAVIPKKFNNEEFFNNSNEETNSLLRELITTLEEKDMNTYLDSKVIGKTAQNYINTQSRIMGRSVI